MSGRRGDKSEVRTLYRALGGGGSGNSSVTKGSVRRNDTLRGNDKTKFVSRILEKISPLSS